MYKKLSDITDIYIGQPIRDRIIHDASGDYWIVQIKDVDADFGIHQGNLYRTHLKGRTRPRLVKKNDLLFVSRVFRSSLPYSVLVNIEIPNLVAAPTFLILSINTEAIRPEYLNWFINSETHGGKYFKKYAMGSSVINITKSVLSEMEIPMPTLEIQDQIIKLVKTAKREKEVMETLIEKRRVFIDDLLAQKIS